MTFFLTLFFLLMVFWRPQDWLVPVIYGWPILDGVVYLAVVALFVERDAGRVRFPRTPAVWLLVGLWFATLVSHVPHTYFMGIVNTAPETFKLSFFSLLMLVVLDRPSRLRSLVTVVVGMACFMAVHAIMQQRTGRGFGGQGPLWVNTFTKGWASRSIFFGIFEDPNDLAQMLATAMPLAFLVPRRLGPLQVAGVAAAIVLLYVGLGTTVSRGGTVALAAVAGMSVVLLFPARWMPRLVVLGLVLALVLCAVKGASLMDESARERVVFWGLANRAFKSNPVFGLGYGMFWEVAKSRAAHNAFVACYTEVGLVGYWFWFGLLALGVMGCWRVWERFRGAATEEERYLRRFAGFGMVAMAGFAASAYFLSRAFVFPMFFLMAMLNAVAPIAETALEEEEPAILEPRRDLRLLTVASFASVAYIYVSILLLNRGYG